MAGNIKGITLEIDGNTSKLTDALKKSEKAARDASKSVRDIEKALKFNPGNTELVAQQQRNLQKQIDATKEKLSVLRDSQEQVQKAFENGDLGADEYEAFQREIITTESKLSTLESKLKSSQDEQKNLSEATNGLQTIFNATGKTIDDFANVVGEDVVNAFKKGEGTSEQMEKALVEVGKEMLGTGGDAENLQDKLDKLGDGVSFDELKESAKESGQWIDKLGDEASESKGEIEKINDASISVAGVEAAVELFGHLLDAAKLAVGAVSEAWKKSMKDRTRSLLKRGQLGNRPKRWGRVYQRLHEDTC